MTDTHVVPDWRLHHRLALALEFSGIAEQAMADELGVHINTVRNYRSGRRSPNRAVLRTWAQVTGVSFEWVERGVSDTDPVTLEYQPRNYDVCLPWAA